MLFWNGLEFSNVSVSELLQRNVILVLTKVHNHNIMDFCNIYHTHFQLINTQLGIRVPSQSVCRELVKFDVDTSIEQVCKIAKTWY